MTPRGFAELAGAMDVNITGRSRIGLTFVASCPACGDGRLLAWTYRPSRRDSGFRCADCGRDGSLLWLDLLSRKVKR